MTIYEALGIGDTILMCCIGHYVVGRLVYEGLKRVIGRLEIGQETEDAAVRDFLAVKSAIGGGGQ